MELIGTVKLIRESENYGFIEIHSSIKDIFYSKNQTPSFEEIFLNTLSDEISEDKKNRILNIFTRILKDKKDLYFRIDNIITNKESIEIGDLVEYKIRQDVNNEYRIEAINIKLDSKYKIPEHKVIIEFNNTVEELITTARVNPKKHQTILSSAADNALKSLEFGLKRFFIHIRRKKTLPVYNWSAEHLINHLKEEHIDDEELAHLHKLRRDLRNPSRHHGKAIDFNEVRESICSVRKVLIDFLKIDPEKLSKCDEDTIDILIDSTKTVSLDTLYEKLSQSISFNKEEFVENYVIKYPSYINRIKITEFLEEFIEQENTNAFFFLIGDAGSGKTTTLGYIEHYLIEKEKIVINLNFAQFHKKSKSVNLLDFLYGYITEKSGINISKEKIREGIENKRILFLFDAFDEYGTKFRKIHSFDPWLEDLEEFVNDYNAIIFLSCRTTIFRSKSKFKEYLEKKNYHIYELIEWDDDLILNWIEANKTRISLEYKNTESESLLQRISEVKDLKKLCQNPFLLKGSLEVLNKLEKTEGKTRIKIYDELIKKRIEENRKQIPENLQISIIFKHDFIRKILKIIAYESMTYEESVDNYGMDCFSGIKLKNNPILTHRESNVIENCDKNRLFYYLRNNSLFNVKDKLIIFAHHTFAEFLIAEFFIDILNSRNKNNSEEKIKLDIFKDIFSPVYFSLESIKFLFEMLDEGFEEEEFPLPTLKDFRDFLLKNNNSEISHTIMKWLHTNRSSYPLQLNNSHNIIINFMNNQNQENFLCFIEFYLNILLKYEQNQNLERFSIKDFSIEDNNLDQCIRDFLSQSEEKSEKNIIFRNLLGQIFLFFIVCLQVDNFSEEITERLLVEAETIANLVYHPDDSRVLLNCSKIFNLLTWMFRCYGSSEKFREIAQKTIEMYEKILNNYNNILIDEEDILKFQYELMSEDEILEELANKYFEAEKFTESGEKYYQLYEINENINIKRYMLLRAAISYEEGNDTNTAGEYYSKLANLMNEGENISYYAKEYYEKVLTLFNEAEVRSEEAELIGNSIQEIEIKLNEFIEEKEVEKRALIISNKYDKIAADIVASSLFERDIYCIFADDIEDNKVNDHKIKIPNSIEELYEISNNENFNYIILFGSFNAVKTGHLSRIFEEQKGYNKLLQMDLRYRNIWKMEINNRNYILIAGTGADFTIKAAEEFKDFFNKHFGCEK